MSRIIVKNLPKKITADKLSEIFSSKGYITDLQLKYTKEGAFRQFAFIGFKEENEAQDTKEYFHNTYIGASKIKVEICTNLGEPVKYRTWNKILKDETVHNRKSVAVEEQNNPQQIKKLKGDSQFSEFMELSKSRKSKPIWSDGADDFRDLHDRTELNNKVEFNETLSSHQTQNNRADDKDKKGDNIDKDDTEVMNNEQKCYDEEKTYDDEFTLKLRNLPYQCKKKHIREFFHPLKPASLRCPPKCKGFAYIKFKTEKEMKQAATKHRGFLGGHRIDVIKYKKNSKSVSSKDRRAKVLPVGEDEESIAESGRIYVRNLCYTATEEEVGDLFSKYGPLAEVHLPIDSFTKKGVGFAFISYMFPEHATKAFTELDGTVFQGRLLHLIPSKSKKKIQVDLNAELSYKEKKEAKLKALSVSSHNWNTLFLGANAVADAMTEKYNTSKSQLLSNESKDSVAVRMALGETQLVMETRDFLLKHGVQLDAFNKPATKRSNTVIIAKNLPAKSTSEEIYHVFSKFGEISQVILPPSGITAIVEFQQAEEAKSAFKKLAYSKFQHVPLYLEWAPVNLLATKSHDKAEIHKVKINMQQEETDSTRSSSQVKPLEPETTLFVKNLNFETNEESLKKHFEACGDLQSVSVSKKKDFKTGKFLSMGFGFVQYKQKKYALRALQELQHKELDGHFLQLKISDRAVISTSRDIRKQVETQGQESTKILIRNIPFEATVKEVRDLFSVFGELKSVRLPKKLIGTGTHRGFGFVDFLTRNDAKRAFTALCHSTHLFGRRLVLEWANMDSEDVVQLRKKTADHFYRDSKRTVKKAKLLEDAASVAVDE